MALVTVNEGSGGDWMPICKYDARAGRIFRVDKDNGTSTPVDITRTFRAIFDFENVEVGYILFSSGGAPAWAMVPYGQPMPVKPTNDYKSGFRLHIKLDKNCGGDVRELAGTANVFLRGVNNLHDAYLAGVRDNPGKLPIVTLKPTPPGQPEQGVMAIEAGGGAKKSTNYMPVFIIVGWAARPADMPAPVAGSPAQAARPATNGAANTHMPTPAPAQVHEAVDDFG